MSDSTPAVPADAHEADDKERRAWIRHHPKPETPLFAVTGEEEIISWRAKVRDLSCGGISLVVNNNFEEGALIEVELPSPEADVSRLMLARVVRSETYEGIQYILGCAFLEHLSEEEVQALLSVAE